MTLIFYSEENDKLSYIRCSNAKVSFEGNLLLNLSVSHVVEEVFHDKNSDWAIENYNSFQVYFNEKLWLTLNVEYEQVTDIELGVLFKNDDEYDWKK